MFAVEIIKNKKHFFLGGARVLNVGTHVKHKTHITVRHGSTLKSAIQYRTVQYMPS